MGGGVWRALGLGCAWGLFRHSLAELLGLVADDLCHVPPVSDLGKAHSRKPGNFRWAVRTAGGFAVCDCRLEHVDRQLADWAGRPGAGGAVCNGAVGGGGMEVEAVRLDGVRWNLLPNEPHERSDLWIDYRQVGFVGAGHSI